MINSFKAKVKLAGYHFSRLITNSRTRSHIIKKFTSKLGLVYFGSVDQHDDDNRLVRGFTVSQSHEDDHYCVGTVGDYNVMLVDRSDAVWDSNGGMSVQNWTIMAIDLHTKQDLPHFFIGAQNHATIPYETFFRTFPTIKEVHLGTFENYSIDFTSRFKIYARPNMAIKTERLMPNSAARVMAAHFWPLSAEQNEHVLYIYSSSQRVSTGLLETMLENGLWLAAHLDRQAELV
ncbi:MAG: hypothetical protein WCQ49_00375 [Candidatus Saccharibacteria bacterium]